MIYAFLNGKREQDRYVKAFGTSAGAKIVHFRHFISAHSLEGGRGVRLSRPDKIKVKALPPKVTGIIFAGILRGNGHLIELAKRSNVDIYYVDHPYFNKSYNLPQWMRITKNGFAQNTILQNIDKNRFKDNFNLEFKDYDFKDKENILVLPPSNVVSTVLNQSKWEENTIRNIRKFTDRPIVVRRKPGPTLDSTLTKIIHNKKNRIVYDDTLDEALEKAYCVVAYNSTVALDALRMGIPVICERYCPAFPLSHQFSEIEDLQEKDREVLFQSLAHGQYTLEEASNPETFKYINENEQWSGKFP